MLSRRPQQSDWASPKTGLSDIITLFRPIVKVKLYPDQTSVLGMRSGTPLRVKIGTLKSLPELRGLCGEARLRHHQWLESWNSVQELRIWLLTSLSPMAKCLLRASGCR